MDIRKIRKLIELIEETGVAEIEVQDENQRVRIVGKSVQQPTYVQAAPQHVIPASAPQQQTVVEVAKPQAQAQPAAAQSAASGHMLKSPMVGTYYSAASPGAKPFVTVGQTVKVGDPICIIEAMKMFNEIEADKAGTVTAILVENGQPVEFDQPLIVIE